jgi:hypothetical protein
VRQSAGRKNYLLLWGSQSQPHIMSHTLTGAPQYASQKDLVLSWVSRIPSIEELNKIWEPRKEYIEKDLWFIRNFLSKEELSWFMELANDPSDWYTVMRSPYNNIKNKFIGYQAEYREDGIMILPQDDSVYYDTKYDDFDIHNRIASVVPKHFANASNFQSFFEVDDEEIKKTINGNSLEDELALPYHFERDDSHPGGHRALSENEPKMTAAISIYLNDDYNGGVLKFKYKDYEIKPEAGMLINIPLYSEFTHGVTKVTDGNRHTLYGRSWERLENRPVSTNEDC